MSCENTSLSTQFDENIILMMKLSLWLSLLIHGYEAFAFPLNYAKDW